jgi:hypothetical protein
LGWDWREPIAVPRSLQRFLLVGTRKIATSKQDNVGSQTPAST